MESPFGQRPGFGQPPEVAGEVGAALVSCFGVLGDGPAYDPIDPFGQALFAVCDRRWGLVHDLVDDRGQALSGKGLVPRHQFVEDGSERKNVGSVVDLFARDLFRRHIKGGAHDRAGQGQGGGGGQPGDAEVDDVGCSLLVDEDIRRFDIAVDDAFPMGIVQGVADPGDQSDDFFELEPLARCQELFQALAVHIFHGDKRLPQVFAHFVDGDNIGMGEVPGRAGFAHKPHLSLLLLRRVAQELETDRLDGHGAFDVGIQALVDDAHGSFSELALEDVLSYPVHIFCAVCAGDGDLILTHGPEARQSRREGCRPGANRQHTARKDARGAGRVR